MQSSSNFKSSNFEFLSAESLFAKRVAVLATMHRKETVIAPVLEHELGLQVLVPTDFDTDQFGTFSREVKRAGSQLEAARVKAQQAMQLTGQTLALASEGAFGPHPAMPYLPYNREIILLLDQQHQLEIVGEAVSTATNYSHKQVSTLEEARHFAAQVGFPQHGLVVIAGDRPDDPMPISQPIIKGITTEADLAQALEQALSIAPAAWLETDMRALYNPQRLLVIQQATENLVAKIRQTCPRCGCPGFDVWTQKSGLPCAWCQQPTTLIRSVVYGCQRCGFEQEEVQEAQADPAYCAYCNP
jgi:hypothetical protein